MEGSEKGPRIFVIRTHVGKESLVAETIISRIINMREKMRKFIFSQMLKTLGDEIKEVAEKIPEIKIEKEEVIKRIIERRLKNYSTFLKKLSEDLYSLQSKLEELRQELSNYDQKEVGLTLKGIPAHVWERVAESFYVIANDYSVLAETFIQNVAQINDYLAELGEEELSNRLNFLATKAGTISQEASSIYIPKVYSIIVSENFPGYILVEGESYGDVEKVVMGIRYARLPIPESSPPEEIAKIFSRAPKIEIIQEGDVIEVTKGDLKGFRGRVISVDPRKKEVKIEILDSAHPLAVTLKISDVRIVSQERSEEEG